MSLGEIDRAMLGDTGKTVDLVIRRPGESSDRRITLTIQAMTFEELKKKESIGIGTPLAGRPSLTTARTDRVYGGSAGGVGVASQGTSQTGR